MTKEKLVTIEEHQKPQRRSPKETLETLKHQILERNKDLRSVVIPSSRRNFGNKTQVEKP